MNPRDMVDQVSQLRRVLGEAESELNWGVVPQAVLEDFKTAVDHIRTDIWAALSTRYTEQYKIAADIVRFRLKRTAELCQQIKRDLDAGEISVDSPEFQQLQATLRLTGLPQQF